MAINVWFDIEKHEFRIRYAGKIYKRTSAAAVNELISSFLPNMVAMTKFAA